MNERTPSRLAAGGGLFLIGAGITALALGALTPRIEVAGPPAAGAPVALDLPAAASPRAAGIRTSYADVLEPALHAVVNIQTTRKVKAQQRRPQMPDFFPWRFPGDEETPQGPEDLEATSLGSGVIVRGDGVVLTNNHVVENADEVIVTLADKRELRAKVVGTDPGTDIAVLKVEDGTLPTLPLGTSSGLRVGDVVFAVGSPFNLQQTATMGIVSAKGRSKLNIMREGYEDFIQTDAAINPGNSGGALIDGDGRLIGINTAIYSRGAAGNQGIGFAVPIDLAKSVMEQILSGGHVVRSQLGVRIKEVDAALAKSYGLPRPEGALVVDVVKGSPADDAGIQTADLIVELDGKPVESDSTLRLDISARKPGSRVEVGLLRDSGDKPQRMAVTATLEKRSEDEDEDVGASESVQDDDGVLRGVQVDDVDSLSPQQRARLGIPTLIGGGALVTSVASGSPAAHAGLQAGDVIVQINHGPVASKADFRKLAKTAGKSIVRVKFRRGELTDIVALEP